MRIRSHGLVSNLSDQVDRALVLRDFGRKAERLRKQLEPHWRYEVPDGLDLDDIPDDVLDVYELAIAPVEFAEQGGQRARRPRVRQGSNNWTIAGRRTATGRPILANDPHRTQGVPSLRYLAHLIAPGPQRDRRRRARAARHLDRPQRADRVRPDDLRDRPGGPLRLRDARGQPGRVPLRRRLGADDRRRGGDPGQGRRARARDAALHPPRPGDRRRRAQADRVRRALGVVRAGHLGLLRLDRLHARGQLDRVRRRACAAGARPGENQVYADRSGHIGWKPCGFSPDPPQLGRAAPRAGRRALRVGRLPRRRRAAGRSATRSAAGSRPPTPRTCRAATRTGGARSASSGRRRSACAASSRCCAGSATARSPTRGGCRSTTAPCRPRGPSRCSRGLEPRSAGRARAIRLLRRWDRVLRAGLRRRRAVRDLELDRAADRRAEGRAGRREGGRGDLAGRPRR